MTQLRVSELAIYPVKSLRGISKQTLCFDSFGPADDRRFVVADAEGRFVTQREYPRMALITVTITEAVLQFDAPGRLSPMLMKRNESDVERRWVTVWRDRVQACDMGDAIAEWLSTFLGVSVRLFYMPDDCVRAVDPNFGRGDDRVSFADGFPVLLIGAASLHAFNQALSEPIGSERFRPNIVVAGAEPYAEDNWRRVRIGAIEFDVVKPCSRCVIPSIDPLTANKQVAVSQALARLRRRGDAVYFGQNLIHRGSGSINVGDTLTVLA